MAPTTIRITVLASPDEKAMIKTKARAADLSVGELMRRAAFAFKPCKDEQALEEALDQILTSAVLVNSAIDEAVAFVEASEKRIALIEARPRSYRSL